ncbi:peroxiredoxin family protein [bacterium]|nr:peroxiredoxin family protein [bacterium]
MMRPNLIITVSLLLAAFILLFSGCGDAPTDPVEQRGTLVINGIMPSGSPADSVWIMLDSETLGTFANPHQTSVFAGNHFLEVKSFVYVNPDSSTDYFSAPQYVEVLNNQTVIAEFQLETDIPIAPYAGAMAPDFTVFDIASNQISLADLSGKIAVLYFYSFT